MNVDILIKTIKSQLNNNSKVNVQDVQKGTRKLTGISIGTGSIVPVVYVEDYDNLFKESGYEEVARVMIETCKNAELLDISVTESTNWDYVKDHLVLCIAPKGTNKDNLTIPYLDLELYFRVKIGKRKEVVGSYKVKEEMLKSLNVTTEILLETALNNTDYITSSMMDILADMLSDNGDDLPVEMLNDADKIAQVVITNISKTHGASAIYKKEILKKLADKYESDLYIIPSSIHEIIVLPYDKSISIADMNMMIKDTNENEVAPEERLSDHVYIFRRNTMEIEW